MRVGLLVLMATLLFAACAMPTPTSSPTAASRNTPAPTATPRPTETVTPTVTPAYTPTPERTVKPTRTAELPTATPELTFMQVFTSSSTSPDKKWIAQSIAAFPIEGSGNYYTQLKVARTDGAMAWIVVDEWAQLGLGYTTPEPFLWSSDGRYLYVTNRPVPDGCAVFVNGSDLHKVDLSGGSVTEVVPHSGLWLSLSPDETRLAYIGYGGRGLVLRDLAIGTERETELNPGQDYSAGHMIWSPDGTALMLTLAIRPCSRNWAESTSVVRVEVATLKQTTLIREDERLFTTFEWPTADKVLLKDGEGHRWWMDATSGQVIEE